MSNLYVMIGLPGSGKSYWANKLCIENEQLHEPTIILSSDEYRKNLYGDESDQTHNNEVFNTLYSDMKKYLLDGKSVIFDATNITVKTRKRIFNEINNIPDVNHVIAYVVCPPIEKCYEQNSMRARKVENWVIDKFHRSFQFPQKFEGFDMIWVNDGINFYDENEMPDFSPDEYNIIVSRMMEFDQRNPHHKYTLGMHCTEVAIEWLKKNGNKNDAGYKAALIHDIGKLFTQTFDENGVAHYYNHDSIGAYIIACNLDIIQPCVNWDELFEVLFCVNYHMRAHNDFKHEKAERKYRALFGNERFDRLMMFGECDRLGNGMSSRGDASG